MSIKDSLCRIDFVLEVIAGGDDRYTFRVRLKPDPERYEWHERDGERWLFDKLDGTYYPPRVLQDLAEQMAGQPIYYCQQEVGEAQAYIRSRLPAISAMLDGSDSAEVLADKSEAFLEKLGEGELGFVILSIDLVGSTQLSVALGSVDYRAIIKVVFYELSKVVPKFHGHVLKYTGDGLIAYFSAPTICAKGDLAVDCALTIHGLVYKALNPLLEERGLPSIDIRIGMDVDDAHVAAIGSSATKRHMDIIGSVIGITTKIEALAAPGEVCLGAALERNIHTNWRQICQPVSLPEDWPYKDVGARPYRVFVVRPSPPQPEDQGQGHTTGTRRG